MANYTITAANVLAGPQAVKETGVTAAGVTITAGQPLYKLANGTMGLCDANGVAPVNVFAGCALHGSLAGQPIVYDKSDSAYTPGFTLAIGDEVAVSATAGALCPIEDRAAGDFVTSLGIAFSSTKIKLRPNAAGVAKA